MPGVMHSVKILVDGELTPEFIATRIKILKEKGPGVTPPDLEDVKKYPDFHKEVLPKYKEIAMALDIQGNFSLPPPIVDPFALVAKLNAPALPDFNFNIANLPTLNPAELAIMIDLSIAEFTAKIPTIFKGLPTPDLMPKFPAPPSFDAYIKINSLEFGFTDKFDFDFWPKGLMDLFPKIFAELAVPTKIFGLVEPTINVDFAIDAAINANLFGPSLPGDLFKKIVVEDLAEFTGQLTVISSTALAIGDGGPSGLVGKMTYDDFKIVDPPDERKDPPPPGDSLVRKKFTETMEDFMGPFDKATFEKTAKSGYQSIGAPGAGPGKKRLDEKYSPDPEKWEKAPETSPGVFATTCGLLPGRVFAEMIRANKDAFGDMVSEPMLTTGPHGNFLFAKFMRCFVPNMSGASIKPGDLYFLQGKLPLTHVAVVYSVEDHPTEPDLEIWRTAEAGWGDSGYNKVKPGYDRQKSVWVRHIYNKKTRRLFGGGGEGADSFALSDSGKNGDHVKGWMDIDLFFSNVASGKYKVAWEDVKKNIRRSDAFQGTKKKQKIWEDNFLLPETEDLTWEEILKSVTV